MHKSIKIAYGLPLLLAISMAGSVAQAAPPRNEEPARPRKAEQVEIPFHNIADTKSLSAPVLSVPTILPWSKVTFQSLRDANDWEIYITNDDGSGQSQFTSDETDDLHPRFNRGATRIAFASDRTGNYEIFIMNSDGSGLTQITGNTTDDVNPFWSPDGTKLAFQAYRDGQAEIYVMNADGSGQTRLTSNADFDGNPAWSPDGSKIAFSSYRNGGYRIWVMNTDGSGQTQLSTQPYSFDPVWSPVGSQIAYDADNDSDGWQDLWRMNANGSSQQMVYDPSGASDAWARSWSPDGRHIAFTNISFINIGGNWYWTSAYLLAWDLNTQWYVQLVGNDAEWNPDWQTTDILAPTSSVNPLPVQSSGPFTVSWSGNDPGTSSLKSYDVQVKDGVGGIWTDWQMEAITTSASYPGVGGHTYYFRARARDHSFNIEPWPASHDAATTVEALPPDAYVKPFAAFTRQGNNLLEWGGLDPGNSGIQTYDVQYRDVTSGGDWTDLIIGATQTSTTSYPADAGYTYAYRARATDNALNVEPWPAEADTQTTYYYWGITGVAHDNAGAPVSSAAITITPHTFSGTIASDVNGNYAAYALNYASMPYLAQWGKLGYGPLTGTTFVENSADANLDIYLPPADNVIANGEFESGDFGGWLAQGLIVPSVTSTVRHTGDYAAVVGTDQLFTLPQNVSGGSTGSILMEQDSSGAVHIVWANNVALVYARRDSNGLWSSPLTLTAIGGSQPMFDLSVEPSGIAHVVWDNWENSALNVYYARRDSNGNWSTPLNISQAAGSWGPQAAVDSAGNLHIAWMRTPPNSSWIDIYYARRDNNGIWSTSQNIANTPDSSISPQIAVDGANAVHVIWEENFYTTSTPWQVWYTQRSASGTWSSPQDISGVTYAIRPVLAVEASGVAHVIWFNLISSVNMPVYHARRATNGVWSAPTSFAVASNGAGLNQQLLLKADASGVIHTVWNNGDNDDKRIFYAQRSAAGAWSGPITLSDGWNSAPQLAINANGLAHVTWNDGAHLVYTRRNLGGVWSAPRSITANSPIGYELQRMLADDWVGGIHLVWPITVGDTGIYYLAPNVLTQTHGSALEQVVTIPITQSTPTLSFLYQFGNFSGMSNFRVLADNGLVSTTAFSTSAMADSWTHQSLDLSVWAGQIITLTFDIDEVAGQLPAWAYIDEVTLGSSYPEIWVKGAGPNTGQPGELLTYHIIYGNHGGAEATGVIITNTLPAELTFVSASSPPASISPALTWEAGDLPAHSGPFTIVITTTVAPTTTLFSKLTNLFETSTASPELEIADNTFQWSTLIGYLLYLPIVQR